MPVTIKPADHGANAIRIDGTYGRGPVDGSLNLLKASCYNEGTKCVEILQSSFATDIKTKTIIPASNGFVKGAIQAYNQHHHLQIRPEDVWFAIISQLSFYVNRHSEELRGMFVAHEGKKELKVTFPAGNRHTVDFGVFAQKIGELIEQNVVDPELRQWAMPAFTTTTEQDGIVASILLMGITQKYFNYRCCIFCGLPSVTLLGEKSDWELLFSRLDKLETFGEEPTEFCRLLRPVISRFVKSFDDSASAETISFWQRMAHYRPGGSGPSWYSGWINAFCFWDKDGNQIPRNKRDNKENGSDKWERTGGNLELDGVRYGRIDSDMVPPGYTSVPVKVNDNGVEFDAMMVAGSVGLTCSRSDGESKEASVDFDTLSAASGWWMFESKSKDVAN